MIRTGARGRSQQRFGRDGGRAVSAGVGDTGIPPLRRLALQVGT